ncbi:MAG: hypothetical protein SGBAC_002976 [Bacillariaceae sp.]
MPAGFRRSRALWDETKRLDHTASSRAYATVCAILYELQPIRFSKLNIDWRQMIRTALHIGKLTIRGISYLPGILRILAKFCWQRKLGCLGVVAYYFAVRWIHEVLEAGPMVVMFTVLIGIFTIGLSDGERNPEGLSAYSVFNRGFERLLGSVDAEALLAQHVGMAPGAALPIGVDDPPPRPRRRQARAAAPRVEAQVNNDTNGENDNGNGNDDNNEEDDDDAQRPRNNNQARKSGKKARRRNVEQRRDRQRQRDAALALGMQGAAETEQEMIEMQRLIENQIADANNA